MIVLVCLFPLCSLFILFSALTPCYQQPAGIYHRYTNDEKNDAKVMRLFQGVPVWTPYNRSSEVDQFDERKAYSSKYLAN
jgi:hypothetical protein